MTVLPSREFVWACGFFEGEGTVAYHPRNKSGTVRRLSCVQKNPEGLYRLQAAFECGKIYPRKNETIYVWQVSRWEEVEPLLRRMMPWLCSERRAKAEIMLAHPPWKPNANQFRCGHPKTDENSFVNGVNQDGSNKLRCRACVRIRSGYDAQLK